ncbi:carcinoembryonic antigen-related cell adhesion molecule 3-like isoform X1 [Pelobates cultripes]|uniref:Carcinoembryonic antigen-related cell adhesion molecule 3-like isoform X1 n=1 Tax=Pelobates cultripes TaxID=61616 RepID=A0AAD1WLU5_PELCU|nr:carcinoembryonic antigen-related cell adhesion molecule 3-like isoform X1 [Pelobates cultripes]
MWCIFFLLVFIVNLCSCVKTCTVRIYNESYVAVQFGDMYKPSFYCMGNQEPFLELNATGSIHKTNVTCECYNGSCILEKNICPEGYKVIDKENGILTTTNCTLNSNTTHAENNLTQNGSSNILNREGFIAMMVRILVGIPVGVIVAVFVLIFVRKRLVRLPSFCLLLKECKKYRKGDRLNGRAESQRETEHLQDEAAVIQRNELEVLQPGAAQNVLQSTDQQKSSNICLVSENHIFDCTHVGLSTGESTHCVGVTVIYATSEALIVHKNPVNVSVGQSILLPTSYTLTKPFSKYFIEWTINDYVIVKYFAYNCSISPHGIPEWCAGKSKMYKFKGRVEFYPLNASLLLKNVQLNDTGIYTIRLTRAKVHVQVWVDGNTKRFVTSEPLIVHSNPVNVSFGKIPEWCTGEFNIIQKLKGRVEFYSHNASLLPK